MSSAWAAFAATGDPNGEGRPEWAPYDPSGTAMRMIFGPQTGAVSDDELARRRFLEETFPDLYRIQ